MSSLNLLNLHHLHRDVQPYVLTRIYLASRYTRIAEMQGYRDELRERGYLITSRWVEGEHKMTEAPDYQQSHAQRQSFAQDDYDDLQAADWVISFTEEPRTPGATRGGRHVECGLGLAWGKRTTVIGHRENVFHYLPQVEFFETWHQFARTL